MERERFWNLYRLVLGVFAVAVTVRGLLYVGSLDPEWSLQLNKKGKRIISILCILSACCIVPVAKEVSGDCLVGRLLLGVFAGCLLAAGIMDWWERMVYRYVWWIGGAAAAGMFLVFHPSMKALLPFGIFVALQYGIFGRFYGRADCHAFCVCALMMTVLRFRFQDYVMHMAIVFAGLTMLQLFRGNVCRNGRLKEPVALVPYIAVGFWLWVDFASVKWYI
jgi:hypothetical protein